MVNLLSLSNAIKILNQTEYFYDCQISYFQNSFDVNDILISV